MLRMTSPIGFCAALVLAIAYAGGRPAAAQAPSSYQNSCTNISIAGATLVATCRRINGTYNRSSIVLRGIDNIDGNLQFSGLGHLATFQESCTNIRVAGATLTATCRRINGSYANSAILIPGLSNINGVLQY